MSNNHCVKSCSTVGTKFILSQKKSNIHKIKQRFNVTLPTNPVKDEGHLPNRNCDKIMCSMKITIMNKITTINKLLKKTVKPDSDSL